MRRARERVSNEALFSFTSLKVGHTQVTPAFKGKSFIVCIASRSVLYGNLLPSLCSVVREFISPISNIWEPNGNWIAPESYRYESGNDLINIVLGLNVSFSRSDLQAFKQNTMLIESMFLNGGRRQLNLNPGIALPQGVLVASHKPRGSIREHIGGGIWGQWVLTRRDGIIKPSLYSFDEYYDGERLDKFAELCEMGMRQDTPKQRFIINSENAKIPNKQDGPLLHGLAHSPNYAVTL